MPGYHSVNHLSFKRFKKLITKLESISFEYQMPACQLHQMLHPVLKHACGKKQPVTMLAIERSADVTPEVNLRECTSYMPPLRLSNLIRRSKQCMNYCNSSWDHVCKPHFCKSVQFIELDGIFEKKTKWNKWIVGRGSCTALLAMIAHSAVQSSTRILICS